MDPLTIHDAPYHTGGRYGPGQEVYYVVHILRLWKWYCLTSGTPFKTNDVCKVYRQNKHVLQETCRNLGLSTEGTKNELIAALDRYNFTDEQIERIGSVVG